MNDSTSTISPAWPTVWPKDSFRSPWAWVIAILLVIVIVWAFVVGINSKPLPQVSPLILLAGIVIQGFAEIIVIAVILGTLPALSKFSLADLGFRMPSGSTIGIAVLGAVAMAVVANGGASLIDYFLHSTHEQGVVELFKGLRDPTVFTAFVFFAVVFQPFVEETIFRIFFFNFGLRFGGFWAGAILSGVLFGLAHGDLVAAVPLALGAIVLCWVYYRTRNAYASMISHGLFNTFSILALHFAPNLTK